MSPENFLQVARCVSIPMMLVDSRGNILGANPASSLEFNRPVNELIGKNLTELVSTPPDSVKDFLRTSSRSRSQYPCRLAVKKDECQEVDFLFEGSLAEPSSGEEPALLVLKFRPRTISNQGFIALNQKINELTAEVKRRKRLEDERTRILELERESRLFAEQASRTKDEFLAVVSHELRAPLNVFKGWVDLLVSGDVESDQLTEVYLMLKKNCDHQVRLIEDLLDTSRVITGKLKLENTSVNIATIVEDVTELIRTTAETKGIELFVSANPNVGSVSGDPDRLQQIIWNLLSNAVKFSPKGGRIFLTVRRVASKVEIKITDEGEGIKPEFLPYVFERFRQEDSTKTRYYGGLGLGLAIVRHLVELHGGTVTASSLGKGRGASFSVTLPLLAINIGTPLANAASAVGKLIDSAKGQQSEKHDRPLEGIKILVVDDELDARNLISRILQRQGAEVVTAGSAKDALAEFVSAKFDFLVSDIGMPHETGYDLIRKIRLLGDDRGGSTPAAALTGFASCSDRQLALKAGFHEHLTKPVEAQKLVKVVVLHARKNN